MVSFDAVGIEHALARFFGKPVGARGNFYDADVLRSGNPKDLSEIIRRVADTFEARIAGIKFPEGANGNPKAQVQGCVSRLRSLSDRVKQRSTPEREDYHWEVFGALMLGIVGLLEALEAQAAVQ